MLDIYQGAIRPLLFSGLHADPEWLHQQTLTYLARLDPTSSPSARAAVGGRWFPQPADWLRRQMDRTCCFQDDRLHQSLWGLMFHNPMGLAAGFDKDAVAAGLWPSLGFGLAELGTVTHHPQPGNPRPRLFRLVKDQAALNRMGFNNAGAEAMAARLASAWSIQAPKIPMGINLGKSKVTPLEAAADDYVASFRLLRSYGDYFVVNVSSPNTPGLRSLQSADQLAQILTALQDENQGQKPLLVKIAPDLEWEAIADVIHLAQTHQLAGIIATNTTICRDNLQTRVIAATGQPVTEEAGGISGAPVRQRSTEVIRFISEQTQGQLTIIGVGGIFTAADAWEKLTAGASLLQVYTGWIYEGPLMVKRILQGLGERLETHGFAKLSDAVGSATVR